MGGSKVKMHQLRAEKKAKLVDTIYFDFAKAFDTVPHRRLLKKIEEYVVKNEVLLWVESFLKEAPVG